MKRRLFSLAGKVFFYLTWPGIWLVIHASPPRTRVIIIQNNAVLLVKDWLGTGSWKLPGGGLKRREPALHGAVREVTEETGIILEAEQLVYLGDFRSQSNGFSAHIVGYSATLESRPQVRVQAHEIAEYTWQPIDQLRSVPLSKTTIMMLKHFKKTSNFDKL